MQPSPSPVTAPSILIVDDTPENLQLLNGMLKSRGYKARPVPSGEMALRAAKSDPPDLVLLDINMPEMNGYEVCRRLKADPQLASIPVIFISALNETMDKVKAFGLGGVDYVTKPFQFEEVHARVETHLKLRQLQKELERQNQQLKESYDRLRELETLRDNLVHLVVHDLRSPLAMMAGYVDLIKVKIAAKLNASEVGYIDVVGKHTAKLLDMVTTLLDVSRMEAGQMPLNRQACDLAGVAKEVVDSFSVLAGRRQLSIESLSGPLSIHADKDVLQRVIANLVGNAVKFTPDGGRISVTISRKDLMARVAVTDSGPGIPTEYHTKVFEKFGQVDKQARRHSTGLGLTFCKLAVHAHGGEIGVESEVGKGSTFWFALPLR
ncbi:MAG: hybrid sensor histidine kinase/response regulator [Verrucomicrobia bacterium]|nr:hybrid sensor histidine kinase/response regulator [Verrucomicrobiota bacterium]